MTADDLDALPSWLQASAHCDANGEVRWPVSYATDAVDALAHADRLLLGLDARRYDEEGCFAEVPLCDLSGIRDVTAARDAARAALNETEVAGDWVLVTWQAAQPALRFSSEGLVHMDKGSYMWVSIKRFQILCNGAERDLLAALLRMDRYRDHYAGPFDSQGDHRLHGPYCLDYISVEAFETMSAEAAAEAIQRWARADGPLSDAARHRLESLVLPQFSASSLYRLHDLGDAAQHEFGSILGVESGFHEIVAINHSARTLKVVVASDD